MLQEINNILIYVQVLLILSQTQQHVLVTTIEMLFAIFKPQVIRVLELWLTRPHVEVDAWALAVLRT